MSVIRQNILSTIMLKNGKLSNGNVRLHLAKPEICQARKLSNKPRILNYIFECLTLGGELAFLMPYVPVGIKERRRKKKKKKCICKCWTKFLYTFLKMEHEKPSLIKIIIFDETLVNSRNVPTKIRSKLSYNKHYKWRLKKKALSCHSSVVLHFKYSL